MLQTIHCASTLIHTYKQKSNGSSFFIYIELKRPTFMPEFYTIIGMEKKPI